MISLRLLVPLCAILAACGTSAADDVDPGNDAGKDGSTDGKTDTGADSGKDTGADTGMDTGIDTGMDAGEDGDADDPDADPDAPPPPDASMDGGGMDGSSVCNSNFGFGSISMNGCSSGENWTCGNDTYQFECFCPGATCVCTKNNVPVQKVQSNMGCPNCSFSAQAIAQLCGFPY